MDESVLVFDINKVVTKDAGCGHLFAKTYVYSITMSQHVAREKSLIRLLSQFVVKRTTNIHVSKMYTNSFNLISH